MCEEEASIEKTTSKTIFLFIWTILIFGGVGFWNGVSASLGKRDELDTDVP